MEENIYQFLQQLGYSHPIHPVFTHLPIGLVVGGFLFTLFGKMVRNRFWYFSGRHCAVMALLFVPLTIAAGYLDWQHYYAGAWLLPIKIKMALAGALIIALFFVAMGRRSVEGPLQGGKLPLYLLCVAITVALGYLGGELVYGKKNSAPTTSVQASSEDPLMAQGRELFEAQCSVCHFSDSNETKLGPGLKGLTALTQMPRSGWAMNDANIRRQMKTPFEQMPPFTQLTPQEEDALLAFLKTL